MYINIYLNIIQNTFKNVFEKKRVPILNVRVGTINVFKYFTNTFKNIYIS